MIEGVKKSRTIKFQVIMAAIDAAVVMPQAFEPFMSAKAFGAVVLVLSVIHKAGNVYLRYITTGPVK